MKVVLSQKIHNSRVPPEDRVARVFEGNEGMGSDEDLDDIKYDFDELVIELFFFTGVIAFRMLTSARATVETSERTPCATGYTEVCPTDTTRGCEVDMEPTNFRSSEVMIDVVPATGGVGVHRSPDTKPLPSNGSAEPCMPCKVL